MLCDAGERPTAVYLKIWLEDELSYLGSCPWEEDLAYVRRVCAEVGVPLEVISLQKEYHERVVAYLLDQVRRGLTPNPDIMCNQQIKFGMAYEALGDPTVQLATGHYAQTERAADGTVQLLQAVDRHKDQTYFLALLSQQQLQRACFPIGGYTKLQVREYAQRSLLPNAARKDSQGICFLGKIPFAEFLRHHLGTREGRLVEFETGALLGRHSGYWFYTVGQRAGIGLSGGPWYVVRKAVGENTVYVSRDYRQMEAPFRSHFTVPEPCWIAGTAPGRTDLQVKVRHGEKMHAATVVYGADGAVEVSLHEADQGIAAGQFAVFYHEGVCLGGGMMVQQEGGG